MAEDILFIARNRDLLISLPQILREAGYTVLRAASLDEARALDKERNIALAMIALRAFGPAGDQLAQELQDRVGRMIVLAESADQVADIETRFPKALIIPTHPLERADVVETVKKALAKPKRAGRRLAVDPEIIQLGEVVFDTDQRSVITIAGGEIQLTVLEFKLLKCFIRSPNRILKRGHLESDVYGQGSAAPKRAIDNLVSHLRKKIETDPKQPRVIVSVSGEGYRLAVRPTTPLPAMSKTNLPELRAGLIGRADELAELSDLLERQRLVTIVGPGGIGKTRLALELARKASQYFPDGVWLIDLAPLADPALVANEVAAALKVALRNPEPPVETLAASLRGKRTLIIFDNCDRLVPVARELIDMLLERAPGLKVIVTSQETLRLAAEQTFRLSPLALPPVDATAITGFGAIDLFVERARQATRDFSLDAGNAAAVSEICRHLDGVPLTLEIVAAHLPLFDIEGLRTGLADRLRVFRSGLRTRDGRYQTLRGIVEWSHGLLASEDHQTFRRLALFPGSFSQDAAIAVVGPEGDGWETVGALGRLIDKSLLIVDGGAPRRYRFLETLRLYAMEMLTESGEHDIVAERHARYFMKLFEQGYEDWETTPEAEWLLVYRPEIDNVRVSLDWAYADTGRAEIAIRLAGSAAILWERLSLLAEGRHAVGHAAGLVNETTPLAAAARVFRQFGVLWHSANRLHALPALERSAELYRRSGDRFSLGAVLATIGVVNGYLANYAEAETALAEAKDILSGSNRHKSVYNVMNNLGLRFLSMHRAADAKALFLNARDTARILCDTVREMQALANLAESEFGLGALDTAIELALQAVNTLRSVEKSPQLGWTLLNLSSYLAIKGNFAQAWQLAAETLSLIHGEGGHTVRAALQLWALLLCIEKHVADAAGLAGFVDAGYFASSEMREPTELKIHGLLTERLSSALPADVIRDLAREGARWTESEALDLVRQHAPYR